MSIEPKPIEKPEVQLQSVPSDFCRKKLAVQIVAVQINAPLFD